MKHPAFSESSAFNESPSRHRHSRTMAIHSMQNKTGDLGAYLLSGLSSVFYLRGGKNRKGTFSSSVWVVWKYLNLQLWVRTVYLHNLQWSRFIGLCPSPLPPPPQKKKGGGGGGRKRKKEKKRRQFCMCTTSKKLCAVCVTASTWKRHCAHLC